MKTYGALELTVSSPSQRFHEPLTVAQVTDYLEITIDEASDIPIIEALIAAAREVAESLQGRDLITKQYDLYLDYFPGCEIELNSPLQSVDLIEYRNSAGTIATYSAADYVVDTARSLVLPAYGTTWPCFTPYPSSAVLVRFTSGYTSTHPFWSNAGQRVRQGMKMLISHWYEERKPVNTDAASIAELPYTITALLSFGAVQRVR